MTTCKPGDLVATGPNKYGDVGVALVTANGWNVKIAELATSTNILTHEDGTLLTKEEMLQMAVEFSRLFAAAPAMRAALEQARDSLNALSSLCGSGLDVMNWHLNGEAEPFDNLVEADACAAALEAVQSALAQSNGE
ncbi:hypothetical protein [uncultured Desulfovibrio sp.]|uniref:hypothetical protein n=1 Tax=uncultured Desulfovibrio sp. TaxID=167968 RepID=UPI002673108F|nr:hypothetical protein [uncultured Desulfovibrio sp.]